MTNTNNHIAFLKKWGFLLPFFIFLVSCVNDLQEVKNATQEYHFPDMEAFNISVYRSDSAHILFHLKSPHMIQYETNTDTPYVLFPEGIEVEQYDRFPHQSAYLKAHFAKYLAKKKIWILRDSIKILTRDNRQIFAEELFWNQNTEKIYSDKNIKIQKGKEVIFGKGFESDQYLEQPKIKHIKGSFYIDD